MSVFSEQVHISVEGFTQNVIYYDLELSQKMAAHHHFSFLWQYSGKPIIEPTDQEKAITNFMGAEVIFTFKVNGVRLMSKGKITKLESIDLHGSPVGLHVTGDSHTIAIDDMAKSRIFSEKNLQQIALEIFGEESSGEFYQRESIVPTYTKEFKTVTQYNETSFDFLKRLSARYAQWYYFDGMRMQLGQIKGSKVELLNESSLHNFKIEAHLVSHKTSFGGYDYNNVTNLRSGSETTTKGSDDRFATIAGSKQPMIVRPGLVNGAYTNNAQTKEEIEQMVQFQTAGNGANSIFYSGTSYLPIGLGQMFTIQNKTVTHQLVAIEVIHYSDVNGNYNCKFKAIPSDVAAPHYTDVSSFATAESQSAVVVDNNDPNQLGRIRVNYYWAGTNTKSDWMRVVQPYGGSGKGLYFRPEIGEEVHVAFEGGNAECPYVNGTYYNGNEMPEFFDAENRIKGWKLRFGMLFKFIEKIGIWLSDPSGNEIHLDEESKNMTLTTKGTLTLNCENLVLNVNENMTTNVIVSKNDIIGVHSSENVGGIKKLGVIGDYNAVIEGKYSEHIKGNFESKTENDRHDNSKKGMNTYTDGTLSRNAQKEIQNNSGERTRQN